MHGQIRFANAKFITRFDEQQSQSLGGKPASAPLGSNAISNMPRPLFQRIVELMTQIEDADIITLIVHKDVFGGGHPTGFEANASSLVLQIAHILRESIPVHAGRRIFEPILIRRKLAKQCICPFRLCQPRFNQLHGRNIASGFHQPCFFATQLIWLLQRVDGVWDNPQGAFAWTERCK